MACIACPHRNVSVAGVTLGGMLWNTQSIEDLAWCGLAFPSPGSYGGCSPVIVFPASSSLTAAPSCLCNSWPRVTVLTLCAETFSGLLNVYSINSKCLQNCIESPPFFFYSKLSSLLTNYNLSYMLFITSVFWNTLMLPTPCHSLFANLPCRVKPKEKNTYNSAHLSDMPSYVESDAKVNKSSAIQTHDSIKSCVAQSVRGSLSILLKSPVRGQRADWKRLFPLSKNTSSWIKHLVSMEILMFCSS